MELYSSANRPVSHTATRYDPSILIIVGIMADKKCPNIVYRDKPCSSNSTSVAIYRRAVGWQISPYCHLPRGDIS